MSTEPSNAEHETQVLTQLGSVYAVSGKKDEARRMLKRLKELSTRRYVPSSDIAAVHASLGEKDEAFARLEKAYEDRSGAMLLINIWPMMDPLRCDARFADLVRRVGLEP